MHFGMNHTRLLTRHNSLSELPASLVDLFDQLRATQISFAPQHSFSFSLRHWAVLFELMGLYTREGLECEKFRPEYKGQTEQWFVLSWSLVSLNNLQVRRETSVWKMKTVENFQLLQNQISEKSKTNDLRIYKS